MLLLRKHVDAVVLPSLMGLRPGLQAHCAVPWPPRLALAAGSPETVNWPGIAVEALGGRCKKRTPGQHEAFGASDVRRQKGNHL